MSQNRSLFAVFLGLDSMPVPGRFGILRHTNTVLCLLLAVACCWTPSILPAQNQNGRNQIPPGMVRLTFQGDVKLDVLVQYIAQRLDLQFEYSTDLANRTVTIHSPGLVPVEALPVLLGSVLKGENLAVVPSETQGWQRIIDAGEMKLYAQPGDADSVLKRQGPAAPVTQVFALKNVDPKNLTSILQPFMTKTGSNLFTVPNTNVLVATDYSTNVKKIAELIKLIDQPPGDSTLEFYEVKHQQSATLTEQVRAILIAPAGKTTSFQPSIQLFDEPLGNRIIIAGDRALAKQARELLERLDIAIGIKTAVYRLRNMTAERLDKLIQGYIAPQDAKSTYQSTIDEEGNLLVVRATQSVHSQIERLLSELDQPAKTDESPIQFYKLKNARALDVLYSLLALQEAYGAGIPNVYGASPLSPFGGLAPIGFAQPGIGGIGAGVGLAQGMNATAAFPNLQRTNSTLQPNQNQTNINIQTTNLPLTPAGTNPNREFLPTAQNPLAPAGAAGGLGAGLGGAGGVATLPGGARVSADVGTNSLIVFAPANVQPIYKRLIESLDQRRPQVLIEAKIVAVDTTDDFALGVEVSLGDRIGSRRVFKFTSFGLSTVDPTTGGLSIIPSLGFNGAVVDPEVADVVVQALSSHTRARVLASPRILVNDNATGKLESVVSVPFSSVNASETVSTTSLGGDQSAGTIITATPHINEDDHLQLEFDVEFSTFNGAGTAALPPPRQIDRVGSTVTIPDGKTVIVGGLRRVSKDHSFTGLPWAEKIPVIRELTSRTVDGGTSTSFFLFIRPMVLRDSRFADLRFLSEQEADKARLPGDYPVSHPELVQ